VEPGFIGAKNARMRGLDAVICSTLEESGFNPHSLPAVGIFDVIEHINDDDAFLLLLHELLIPNGRLYLTVPAYQWLWSVTDKNSGHFRRYSLPEILGKLKKNGFCIEYASYFFMLLIFPTFLFRVLPDRLGFRKNRSTKGYLRELSLSSNWMNRMFDCIFDMERKLIGKGLPFGGSCLVVVKACENF